MSEPKEQSRTQQLMGDFAPKLAELTGDVLFGTVWHAHALGQTLIVTYGCGRVQRWDGSIEEIRPGDVVWIAPGEKHWHGGAPTTAMTHIAIAERSDTDSTQWMEHVSNEQYRGD